MKTLFVHIGTPKTGTSMLQHFFSSNKKTLAELGIYYPEWTDWEHWGGKESTEGNFGWMVRKDMGQEQAIERIRLALEKKQSKILLSSECIWTEIPDKGELIKLLKKAGPDVEIKVIVYLRKQVDYFESQYRECVRTVLMQESLAEVCDFENPILWMVKNTLYYDKQLEEMANIIGRENVIVRLYEKGQLKNQNIIDDFLGILGLGDKTSFLIPEKNYNPPLSNSALELKRCMNTSARASQKEMNDSFYEILMQDGVEISENGECAHFKSMLSGQQRHEFMERFKDSNRFVACWYLHRKDGRLFLEDGGQEYEAATVTEDEVLKQAIRVFTSAFLKNQADHSVLEANIEKLQTDIYPLLEGRQKHLEQKLECMQEKLIQWETIIDANQQEIKAMKNSTCWKITAPFRWCRDLIRR